MRWARMQVPEKFAIGSSTTSLKEILEALDVAVAHKDPCGDFIRYTAWKIYDPLYPWEAMIVLYIR